MPWIHPSAVEYLESILTPDMEVVEFGGGGSTLWFADRVAHVVTYEPNADWYGILAEKVPANVTLRNAATWNGIDACDLLFLDGEPLEKRAEWIEFSQVISGTWIVIDNANRPEFYAVKDALEEYAEMVKRVDGNEPGTKYLLTEFWQVK
jgi:predicted O-methyltransferase YrrM